MTWQFLRKLCKSYLPACDTVVAASFFTSPALVVIFQPFGWLSFTQAHPRTILSRRTCRSVPIFGLHLRPFSSSTPLGIESWMSWILGERCQWNHIEPCGMDLRSLRYLPTEEMAWNGHENSMPCHRWGMTTRDAIPQASLRDATATRVGSSKMDQDDGK